MPWSAYYCPSGGSPVATTLAQVPTHLQDEHGVLWLDGIKPTLEDLAWLKQTFGFHPLAIEDCVHQRQRPKLEDYGSHLFMVLHEVEPKQGCFALEEIGYFLGPNYVVSLHMDPIRSIERHQDVIKRQQSRSFAHGAGHLLHALTDTLVDDYFPPLDRISDAIDQLEAEILSDPRTDQLQRLMHLKKDVNMLRKEIRPMRDVFLLLSSRQYAQLPQDVAIYFRDVYDHLIRLDEKVDSYRDLITSTLEVYLSNTSNRMNAVMKQLTLFTTIFLPLNFVTGVFGMNFGWSPQVNWDHGEWFFAVNVSFVVIAVTTLWWFKHKRWA